MLLYVDRPREVATQSRSDSQLVTVGCNAGNKICSSLAPAERNGHLVAMDCDVCCTVPSFCRDCSCILCCKSIGSSYSSIKCEAPVAEGYICGHVAHMNCALRSYLAGTVGGSIGLDAEYHCRRCDMRTDLVSYVARLLKTCESVDSRDDIEKILGVGICILRGSHKASANKLLNQVELAMAKVRCPYRKTFPFSFPVFSKTISMTIQSLLSIKVGLHLKIFGDWKLIP